MKIDFKPSIVQIEPELLKNLHIDVKETIALEMDSAPSKRYFTSGDLWKIRRNTKTATARLRK